MNLDTLKKYYNPRITEQCRLDGDCISLKLEDTLLNFSMWIDCTNNNGLISYDWNKIYFTESENDKIEKELQPIMYDRAVNIARLYLIENSVFSNG